MAQTVCSRSPDEVRRLSVQGQDLDPRYTKIFRIVVASGAQRGEACALRWWAPAAPLGADAGCVFEAGAAGERLDGPVDHREMRCVDLSLGFVNPVQRKFSQRKMHWFIAGKAPHVVSTHLDQPVRNDDEQNCQGEISDESRRDAYPDIATAKQ